MAFCTFQLLFPTEIFLIRHSCTLRLRCEVTNCRKQFINTSTQFVYETTFIAQLCYNFMSTLVLFPLTGL